MMLFCLHCLFPIVVIDMNLNWLKSFGATDSINSRVSFIVVISTFVKYTCCQSRMGLKATSTSLPDINFTKCISITHIIIENGARYHGLRCPVVLCCSSVSYYILESRTIESYSWDCERSFEPNLMSLVPLSCCSSRWLPTGTTKFSRLSLLTSLLLLCGDVHSNPGPPKWKNPCSCCGKAVR